MSEELRGNPVLLHRELVEDRHDDAILLEEGEDLVERTALLERAEAAFRNRRMTRSLNHFGFSGRRMKWGAPGIA